MDFFSNIPAAATTATTTTTTANNEEDDDWGDFVNSSDDLSRSESLPTASLKPLDPMGLFTDHNGTESSELAQPDSVASRIQSEEISQAQWVQPRGPVPLSVFGEAEEEGKEGEGSDAAVPSVNFSFNSSSDKNDNKNVSVNQASNIHPSVGINNLLANLYRQSEQNKHEKGLRPEDKLNYSDTKGKNWDWSSLNWNGKLSNSGKTGIHVNGSGLNLNSNRLDSSGKVLDSAVSSENLSWNPLNLDSERNVAISSTSGVNLDSNGFNSGFVDHNKDISGANLGSNGLASSFVDQNSDDDEDDGWEFKTADEASFFVVSKNDEKKIQNGPVLDSNMSNLSWNVLSPGSSGTSPNVTLVKTDATKSSSHLVDGVVDSWDNDEWEFKGAEPEEPISIKNKVEGKDLNDIKGVEFAFGFENGVRQNSDLFAVSSQKSSVWGFAFDFIPSSTTQNGVVSYSNCQSKQNKRDKDENLYPSDGNVVSDENSWAFTDLFSKNGTNNEGEVVADISPVVVETFTTDNVKQKKEPELENPKGPLPLSLFGDGEIENEDPVVHEDISTSTPASSVRDQIKMPGSNISITDLISSLYSQVEEKASANLNEKPRENGFGSIWNVNDSDLADGDNGFDDDSWEFKGPAQAVKDSNVAEADNSCDNKGPMKTVINSDLTKGGDDDSDDDSWEFKGAFVRDKAGSQSSVLDMGEQHEKTITKVELNDYADFYSKLKNELCYVALNHLEYLKNSRATGADSGGGTEIKASDEEIQDLYKQLHRDILIHGGVNLENLPLKSICIDEFIQALEEPKFQGLESEYHLSKRLLLAEKDWKSTIELLKDAELTMKILKLGSAKEQSDYVSTWSEIVSVCAQELKHGACVWKQAVEKNIYNDLVSKPQGKKYFLALGEIYRVSKILGASVRLYKPWILVNSKSKIGDLLNECATLWSSSGLEEALQSIISNASGFEYNDSASALLTSVKYIDDLNALSLCDNVFSVQEPTCQISGLTAGTVPGMKMAVWKGEHYFLTLANLWANLISPNPPSLSLRYISVN